MFKVISLLQTKTCNYFVKLIFLWVILNTSKIFSFEKLTHINSWQEIRDKGVVKQQLDYSCGAASLATLLGLLSTLENSNSSQTYTETQILKLIKRKDASSFADLKRVAEYLGYRAIGYKVTLNQLTALKIPVIVFLEHFKNPHF